MDKKTILLIAALVLLLGCANASTVSRSLSSTTVAPGTDLTVTLTVSVTAGETYYAVDEIPPSGWAIKDAGGGAIDSANHLKWLTIENASNTSYTYTLTAPSTTGTAGFAGTYMFEGMQGEAAIAGQNQATVGQPTADYLTIAITAIVVIAVIAIAYKKLR